MRWRPAVAAHSSQTDFSRIRLSECAHEESHLIYHDAGCLKSFLQNLMILLHWEFLTQSVKQSSWQPLLSKSGKGSAFVMVREENAIVFDVALTGL